MESMKGAKALTSAMVWALRVGAGAAVLVCLAAVFLRSERAAEIASARIVEKLEAATGRPASIGACALSLFPPSVEIRDLIVAGPDGSLDHPLLAARRTSASLSMEDLLGGRVAVDEIAVDGVELRYEPGLSNDARDPLPGEPGAPIEIRRLLVRHGTLAYMGSTAPFSIEAADIEVAASSAGCGSTGCLDGTARSGAFRAAFGDHSLSGTAAEAAFSLDPTLLDVRRFSVRGAGLMGSGTAGWRLAGNAGTRVNVSVATTGTVTEGLLGSLPVTAESLELTASVAVVDAAVEVKGHGRLSGVDYPGLASAPWAEGTFALEDGVLTVDVAAKTLSPRIPGPRPSSAGSLTARITRDAEGACEARLEISPIVYRDVLGFVDPRLPVADVTARVKGNVTWHSGDAETLDGSLAVHVEPFAPGHPLPPHGAEAARRAIDLTGSVEVRPRSQSVGLVGARFSFPGAALRFDGAIDRGHGGFDVRVTIDRADSAVLLDALRRFPAAAALADRESLAGPLTGTAHVAVDDRGVTAHGELEGSGLSIRPGPSRLDGVSARANWLYERGRLTVDALDVEGTGWGATAGLVLDTGHDEPLRSATLELRDVPGDTLWAAAGLASLSGGTISGRGRMDLETRDAAGPGRGAAGIAFAARGASYFGVPLETLSVEAGALGPRIEVTRLLAATAAGRVEAAGAYAPDTGDGSFRIQSENVDVGALAAALLPGASGSSGAVSLQGEVILANAEATFRGSATFRQLVVLGVPAGSVSSDIESGTDGTRWSLVAPDLNLTGTLGWPPSGGAVQIDVLLDETPLERLRPLLPAGTLAGLAGKGSGRIWGTIPTGNPKDADVAARFTALTLDAGGTELGIEGECEVTLRDGELWLGSTRIRGEGTDLTISGVYDVRAGLAGAGNASGRFDAALLKLAAPEIDARGTVDVDLHASAEDGRLLYGGRLAASLDSLRFPGAPLPLDSVRLSAAAAPDGTLEIESVAFNYAGGEVAGSGKGRLQGIQLAGVNLRLRGTNLQLGPLPNLTVLFDTSLEIASSPAETTMTGRVDVVRAIYSRELELEASPTLGRVRSAPGERRLVGSGSPALDIDVVAPSDVLVRNSAALLEGSARLHVGGTLAQPEITGRISVFDGGTFRFRGVTYKTEGGGIDFDRRDSVDPLLDLTARTQVQAYEISLRVLGRYSNPRFELTSSPALPMRDIVSLLVTGKTYAETYGQEAGVALAAEENVGQYLTAPLTGTLGSTVERALNLTSVQIEPQFFNGRSDPTARITLTKRISPALLFVYSDSLGTNQEQIYQFQYDLTRAWQLLGTRNADGTKSGDVRFRFRWGLGAPEPAPRKSDAAAAAAAIAPGFESGRVEVGGVAISGFDGDTGPLRKKVGLKPGKTYTRGDILEAREKLREWLTRHSYPLASVRLSYQFSTGPSGASRADLIYEVNAGPHVDTEVQGIRNSHAIQKAVQEALERTVGKEHLAEAGAGAIRDALGGKGYAAAVVRDTTTGGGDRLTIRYDIDRGPKAKVNTIRFEGTASVPESELRRAMETTEDRWNTIGTLRTPTLTADIEAIRAVYLAHGFLDAKVSDPTVLMSPDRKHADVTIRVEEGEAWKLDAVVVEGTTTYPAASLREATLLVRGSAIRPSAVEAAVERVHDVLDANGHNQVRVKSRIDGPPAAAKVVIEVEEGPRQVLSSVSIKGNTRTNMRVISREIPLQPGDPLSRSGILLAQRKLYALGIFRSVELQIVPEREGDEQARLVVIVAEGKPFLTAFGVGYNTEQSLQEFAQIGHDNIFGTGRSASLFVSHSSLERRAQVNIIDRRLFGIPFEGLITAFWEKNERPSFEERRRGGAVQVKHQPTRAVTLLGRYTIEDVSLFDVDPSLKEDTDLAQQDVRLANVAGSIAHDARDDILNPTRGTFSTGDARLYLAAVGSEEQFSRIYSSWAWFRSAAPRTVFGVSVRLGYEKPFGSTSEVPLAERFFAGGDTTLRGLGLDQAGPLNGLPVTKKDVDLKPLGGEFSIILNGEMRFPIYGAVRGIVFYDAGNVFLSPGDFRVSGTRLLADEEQGARFLKGVCNGNSTNGGGCIIQDGFRHTLGAGIRLDTPLGPIRLEYGRLMDRHVDTFPFIDDKGALRFMRRDEAPGLLFLSIGQAF